MVKPYSVKCSNLLERKDRRFHIEKEFIGRNEFSLEVVSAIKRDFGAHGIWLTLQKVVKNEMALNSEFFIFCQDDHIFTAAYSQELLRASIERADHLETELLLGGVSSFQTGIQISENLFWVKMFTGLQFTVIFKNMYQKILDTSFLPEDTASDLKLSSLAENKLCICPFISIQTEFGYSDVTIKNAEEGHVTRLFSEYSNAMNMLKKIKKYYTNLS